MLQSLEQSRKFLEINHFIYIKVKCFEEVVIASYYKQISTDNKMKNCEIETRFIRPEGRG